MTELGLLTPANPVTAWPDPVAAVTAVAAGTSAGGACPPGRPYAGDLPAELQDRGLVRAREWARHHDVEYDSHIQAAGCQHFVWEPNPWVDPQTHTILYRDEGGRYTLKEDVCLLGKPRTSYQVYDLNGSVVCTVYPAVVGLKDPPLPGGNPGPFGPGVVTGGTPFPGGGGPGVAGLPITVSGVNLGDAAKLLAGLGDHVDLSGVLQVLAALVVQGGNIRGALDTLAPALAQRLTPGLVSLGSAVTDLAPGLGGRLVAALDAQGDKARDTARDTTAADAAARVATTGDLFRALVSESAPLLKQLADAYKGALDSLIGAILRLFREDIEAHAPVDAGNVHLVAAAALRSAMTAGSVAQLAGMGLELLHPLKSMGVQQAIGVLAEFAGFSEIAKPYFAATLRYGIGLPAEHRAAAHFRSALPPVETVRELAAIGLVPFTKYHDRLVLQGYPDPFPAALADVVYTPPPARFVAQLLDGSEADRPWLARQFRRLGFSPDNTQRAVRAAELKTTQPGRSRLVGTLLDQYQHGRLERPDLEAGLVAAGLSVTHRAYYLRAADLDRRGYRMELVASAALDAYRNDLAGPETTRQLLTGLGYTDDEVTVRLTAADVRRGVRHVATEVREIEAEIRQLKAEGLRNATRQLRAGFLSPGEFLAIGQGMGYSRAYLANVADLAALQGAPTSTDAAPAIGRGALEETHQRIAELVGQEVQAKRTDRLAALLSLRRLGLPHDLVSVVVELAEALAGPTPRPGLYGMPEGGAVGPAFDAIGAEVLRGLGGIGTPSEAVLRLVEQLGLPVRDRPALVRLIRDVRDLVRS
jgi:hypothetical protein